MDLKRLAPGAWLPSLDQLKRWSEAVKSGSVTLLAAGGATITGIGVFHAVTSDSVTIEPILVPTTFEERGFTAEITTARLLDEIATYQKRTSSSKERISVLSKQQSDDLDRLQGSVSGVDIRRLQTFIQDTLGIRQERITGEITLRKEGDETAYTLRVRRLPGNQVLIDLPARGEPETVIKRAALAMIEAFDPQIAASIFWRDRDAENALRLIDVVLNNDDPNDDKYALNLRAGIHLAHFRYPQAKADLDRILAAAPQFAPAWGNLAWYHRARDELDLSLAAADREIEYAPKKWWGYFHKGQTLRNMKKNEDAGTMFQRALELKPDHPNVFNQIGAFHVAQGRSDHGEAIFRRGILLYADYPPLRAGYGDALKKAGEITRAESEYRAALGFDGGNPVALAGLAELARERHDQKALRELQPRIQAVLAKDSTLWKSLRERLQTAANAT